MIYKNDSNQPPLTMTTAPEPIPVPLVSVIIRSMDRPMLSKALESVASQTYSNIEVIVVKAKGNAHQKIGEYCGHFPVRIVGNNEPLLRSQAANLGLEAARGDYLIFLDDDDWFLPHHIAKLKTEFDHTESAVAVYSAVQCCNESGEEIRRFEEDFDPIQFRIANFIPIHAVLFQRCVVDQGARFDEALPVCEDWDFWLQVLEHGKFHFIPEVGATYYMQNEMNSGVWDNPEKTQQIMTAIYRKWMPRWNDKTLWSVLEYTRYKRLFDELSHTMNERNAQIATLSQSLAERDTRIKELLSSTSWRITRPLRTIYTFLRNRGIS